jgi:lambda family phage portal protein
MSKRKPARKPAQKQPAAVGMLVPQARFDAASHGRRLRGWVAPSTGPNRAMVGAETLRNRLRDAMRNEWAAKSSGRVWQTNLIGTGIVPRPLTSDAELKKKLSLLWEEWVPDADADGVLDFYGLQTLMVKTWLGSMECFVRLRPRRIEDGLVVPLQIQLIEPDLIPVFDLQLENGNRIRSGIEFDRIGRRVAYHMYREHPGDNVTGTVSLIDLVRVPADQILHIFEPERPGQLRGVSDFSAVLVKLRSVMNFDDAVLTRQELANLFAMFITRPASTGDQTLDPATGQPIEYDRSGLPMASLEPGISQELAPGEDVKFASPPDAGANYAEFSRQQHLGIAAGSGTPYELMTGDLKDVSDRTLRVIINEFRRHCEQRQWQVIIPMFCQKARNAWARAALLGGAITADELADARRVSWNPQGWAYIHPTQDVAGRVAEINAGLKSRSQSISERGEDPEVVDQQRAEDAERERRLSLNQPQAGSPAGSK